MNINRERQAVLIGVGLIILGGMALLSNLGLFHGMSGLIGALLFAAGGAYLYRLYSRNPKQFWPLLVSFILFGLGAAALANGPLSGSYFLGLTGAGFALVYRNHPRHWWAVIPAGVLLTLALVAGIDMVSRFDPGPVLFLGFAATFGYLYRIGRRWAIYPALVAAVIAVMSLSFTGGWLLPVILIGVGAYLLSRQGALPVLANGRVFPPAKVHTAASERETVAEAPAESGDETTETEAATAADEPGEPEKTDGDPASA